MTDSLSPGVPPEVIELARARRAARAGRDWPEADRLKALIEAAGWRVVDRGVEFTLHPAEPPDVLEDGVLRHGGSRSVPSRLDDPAVGYASVVVLADRGPGPLARTLAALRPTLPADTQVVVVDVLGPVEAGSGQAEVGSVPAEPSSRRGIEVETVPMAGRVGPAVALNAGIRRATGPAVVVLVAGDEPVGDIVTPLVEALADARVAAAGGWGSVTGDLRRFDPVSDGDADALGATCLAFRRSDYVARGPLDERFLTVDGLAAWWTLVLRDEGESAVSRRAVLIGGLPIAGAAAAIPPDGGQAAGSVTHARKRDLYRIADRFGGRRDLVSGGRP